MDLQISPPEDHEIETVHKILTYASGKNFLVRALPQEEIKKQRLNFLVARIRSKILGVIRHENLHKFFVEIGSVAVAPEARGKKIGKQILETKLAEIQKANLAPLLVTQFPGNPKMISLALGCGLLPLAQGSSFEAGFEAAIRACLHRDREDDNAAIPFSRIVMADKKIAGVNESSQKFLEQLACFNGEFRQKFEMALT